MYVTHDPKTIYLAHPRTASQAIANMLVDHYDAENPYGIDPAGMGSHHGYSQRKLDYYKENGYTVWCVIRDYADWAISIGIKHNRIAADATVEDVERWLDNFDETWVNAMPAGPFSLYTELSDVILCFEDLPGCIAALGFDPDLLQFVDRSEGRKGASHYFSRESYEKLHMILCPSG